MPTYLCHGFRWRRRSIRVYVVVQNLDDASPEWIVRARSSRAILESFYTLFTFLPWCQAPRILAADEEEGGLLREDDGHGAAVANGYVEWTGNGGPSSPSRIRSVSRSRSRSRGRARAPRNLSNASPPPLPSVVPRPLNLSQRPKAPNCMAVQDWSPIKLIEEYDPTDLSAVSRPHAYVADHVVRIDLSASVVDEIRRYELQRGDEWHERFKRLRDQVQRDEEIRWYIVVNGDEERELGGDGESEEPLAVNEGGGGGGGGGGDAEDRSRRRLPTRQMQTHHAQYVLQQGIFEEKDRANWVRREESMTTLLRGAVERRRQPLPPQMNGNGNQDEDENGNGNWNGNGNENGNAIHPQLRRKASVPDLTGRSKTPGGRSLRRLFASKGGRGEEEAS